MASVVLDLAWLHVADDLSDHVTVHLSAVTESAVRPVEVRRYANGRLREITRSGPARTINLEFGLADRAAVDQLRAWVGERLLFRDPAGRAVYGVFDAITVEEVAGSDLSYANASLTFRQVTATAEV